jgi:hypothetical protein
VHPEAVRRAFGKLEHGVVLSKRQVVGRAEILVEEALQTGVRFQEEAPRSDSRIASRDRSSCTP